MACQELFLKDLTKVLKSMNVTSSEILIMGWHWTIIQKDKQGGNTEIKLGSLKKLLELPESFDLQDIWRVKNLDKKSYYLQTKTSNYRMYIRLFPSI